MTFSWDWQVSAWMLLSFFPAALIHELGHILGLRAVGGSGFTIRFGRPGGRVAWADVVWWPAQVDTWQQLAQWWGLWGVVVPLFPLRYPSGGASDGLQVLQVLRDLVVREKQAA